MLNCSTYLTGSVLVLAVFGLQEDPDGRRLDRLCHIDDLFEPGDTQCHVCGGHSCRMEGVEGHLGGRLTHALCTDAASHLSWVGKAALKPRPDFSEQPIEGCLGEPLLLDDMLGAER